MLKFKGSLKHFWDAFVDTGHDNLETEGSKNFIFDSILLRAIEIFYLNYLQFAFSKSLRCQRQEKATKSDPSPILLTIVNMLKVTKDQSKRRQ